MVQNDPSKPPKWAYFWSKISIFGVIYQPLELKIHPKVGLLRPKTMPKHFLNNSKKTSKKSRKRLFRPPKWPNHGCQSGKKCRFLTPFSIYELYFWLVGDEKKFKIVPPYSLKDLKKKKKKYTRFWRKNISKGKYARPVRPSAVRPSAARTISETVVGAKNPKTTRQGKESHSNQRDPSESLKNSPLGDKSR